MTDGLAAQSFDRMADPELAPWRSPLDRALYRNRSLVYTRYAQLATVQPHGWPANRTVVFRGFWDDTDQLKFITDGRSQKVAQIQGCDRAELCWYFPKSQEQFRIAGTLRLITADTADEAAQKLRRVTWHDLSDAVRTQFAWPEPGQPRRVEDDFEYPVPDRRDVSLPNFCVLLLVPCQVDYLELRGTPQNRWLYQLQGDTWTMQAVNP